MLLTAIWNILTKWVPYSRDGFLSSRPALPSKIITKAQGLEILRLRGYSFKEDVASPAPA